VKRGEVNEEEEDNEEEDENEEVIKACENCMRS
jgi:hypothetical protein